MKIVASWGMRLLAVYLILIGLIFILPVIGGILGHVMPILALVTGVLILIEK